MTRSTRMLSSALLAVLWLSTGCNKTHAGSSSGSNWLTCDTVADCAGAEEAVSCNADGYCVDQAGHRIAATPNAQKPRPSDAGRAPRAETGFPTDTALHDAGPRDAGRTPSGSSAIDSGRAPDAAMLDAAPPALTCDWDVDLLLGHFGVTIPERRNCGSYAATGAADLGGAMSACFDATIAAGKAVEVTTFAACTDCDIPVNYIAGPNGERFQITYDQADFFVSECDAILLDSKKYEVNCTQPVERYSCQDQVNRHQSAATTLSWATFERPVEPFKLADVAGLAEDTVTLHLYVTDTNVVPSARLNVYIDGVHVVTGDFDSPGNIDPAPVYSFDLLVPAGMRVLQVDSARDAAQFEQRVEVPAERWVLLEYSDDPVDGRTFSLTLRDQPISFD